MSGADRPACRLHQCPVLLSQYAITQRNVHALRGQGATGAPSLVDLFGEAPPVTSCLREVERSTTRGARSCDVRASVGFRSYNGRSDATPGQPGSERPLRCRSARLLRLVFRKYDLAGPASARPGARRVSASIGINTSPGTSVRASATGLSLAKGACCCLRCVGVKRASCSDAPCGCSDVRRCALCRALMRYGAHSVVA